MTEAEWLAGSEPWYMLAFVKRKGVATDRKLRLFAIACCRLPSHPVYDEYRKALGISERYADGLATLRELREAHNELHSSVYWVRKTKSWFAQALLGFLANTLP